VTPPLHTNQPKVEIMFAAVAILLFMLSPVLFPLTVSAFHAVRR
jgi:hypothetical protein